MRACSKGRALASAGLIFIAVVGLWLLWGQDGGWPSVTLGMLGAAGAGLVVWAAARLGVADREGSGLFARAPATLLLVALRAPGRVRDAWRVFAAALGARARTPVFVRLRLRPVSTEGAAAVVAAMSGAPGAVAIDASLDSLLAHVLVESDVDVAALQTLERDALRAAGASGGT